VPPGDQVAFAAIPSDGGYANIKSAHNGEGGLVYVRTKVVLNKKGRGSLLFWTTGPVRV
jgi:hypothetical protein